ncbi:MAG: cytochrome b [Pseudorhodoplanes sp.]
MRHAPAYDSVAKVLHWLVAALIVALYLIGFLMPSIGRGMQPGAAMNLHISLGLVALALIVVRLVWRLARPVAPSPDLPRWQQNVSEAMHWILYALVLAVTLSGWFYVSLRGWTITLFGSIPVPPLTAPGSQLGRTLGLLHENIVWALLAVTALHVTAALAHHLVYRDDVMRRMLGSRR